VAGNFSFRAGMAGPQPSNLQPSRAGEEGEERKADPANQTAILKRVRSTEWQTRILDTTTPCSVSFSAEYRVSNSSKTIRWKGAWCTSWPLHHG